MPDCRVEFLPAALRDIDAIADFHLAKVGRASAEGITDYILDAIAALADFPLMGPLHPDPVLSANGFRKLVLNQTYVAVYKVTDYTVYIYRIVNGAVDYPKLLK